MELGQWILLAYAALMVVGGLIGAKAGSKVSLFAGLGSGVALLAALGLTFAALAAGLWTGCILAALLTVTFARRFSATKKFMPAGMLLVVSVLAAVLLAMTASKLTV